ncbi:hypothetical protein BaRGS_00010593 [Batillaria attramentaria]|uniref:Uncharacterized protein n=1 Tax=Batillaria attramentaria TaxID=370345 RepID=A0ABD0LGT8_9CAEN
MEDDVCVVWGLAPGRQHRATFTELGGKKRRKHQRESKKFQQLSPHTSPTHSQPSTLGHGPGDPRLPKVSSNGLWVGTPSIYAATPSPAYYYGRPPPKGHGHPVQPAVMQRATSETRLPQQVPGPAIYATGSNQRIYHSQQLTPVYEVMDPRSGSIYDSDRDMAGEQAKRPHRNSKQMANGQRPGKAGSVTSETVQIHETGRKTKTGYENKAFHDSGTTEKIEEVEKVVSATDSMKILAKNKTDDQKTVVHATSSSSTVTSSDTKPAPPTPTSSASVPATANFRDPALVPLHYIHDGGDIYAVPLKEEDKRRTQADNPILARMQDMVIERSEENTTVIRTVDPVTDISETAEPLLIAPVEGSPGRGSSVIQNPIYQEVEEVQLRDPRSDLVISANIRARNSASASAAQSTGEVTLTTAAESTSVAASAAEPAVSASGPEVVPAESASEPVVSAAVSSQGLAGTSASVDTVDHGDGMHEHSPKEVLTAQWSTDTEGATDDLSRAEKHITATAFEFLDTYLSDEDGADIHSPPKSPVLSVPGLSLPLSIPQQHEQNLRREQQQAFRHIDVLVVVY